MLFQEWRLSIVKTLPLQ